MLTRTALLNYSLFAMPLAVVALPIYVYAPAFYAQQLHLSLAVIGMALLFTRLLDAFIDPALGMWMDRTRQGKGYGKFILIALPLLGAGFFGMFNPPAWADTHALVWLVLSLSLVYPGFSLATIAYQSWGAALTQQRAMRSRITGVREAFGLLGVVAAAVLPALIGLRGLSVVFLALLALGAWRLVRHAAEPPAVAAQAAGSIFLPLQSRQFRSLFCVFVFNGIASAIPATLFQFFAEDRLQLGHQTGYLLGIYFIAGAASMPMWVALARRQGEARAWLISMLLAIAAFGWAYFLSAGSATAFCIVCILSGLTLGADLALPPALLAAVINRAGHSGKREGAYFGLWSWATKMNLALAAGAALPLLAYLGYVPGIANAQGGLALASTYALLPCVFKLTAALLLFFSPLHDL
ncbi:MAG TPA: MFS transporter [Burkholderiaceae bacterium]|jgi:Na+/melibiose symporter-like transporter